MIPNRFRILYQLTDSLCVEQDPGGLAGAQWRLVIIIWGLVLY
jgi:hypothetical protein